jgi:CRP-like cAMP-binding protein
LLDNNGSKAEEIIFVESGTLEVLTYMEGNEFVIENLTQGSIINYRSILVQDMINLNMRSLEHTTIQVLHIDSL